MSPRFIDRFDVILLDMARTFMFNVDRFSEEEDFAATYRALGGTALSDGYVQRIIHQVFFALWAEYQNPQSQDRFPSVHSYLPALPDAALLPRSERELLEHVFARHEMGDIPAAYVDALRQLRATHRLGVVSDIWSASRFFLQALDRWDIRSLFDGFIFSSDHGCVKPSPRLFSQALAAFRVDHRKIVFVGDSWERDIAGAKAAGLSAIWINAQGKPPPNRQLQADLIVHDLQDLLKNIS